LPIVLTEAIYQAHLSAELEHRLGISRHFSRRILSTLWASIADHLAAGNRVEVRGFGTWKCKRVGAKRMRVGARNSRTIQIEAHRVPAWRPSPALKRRIRSLGAPAASGPQRKRSSPGRPANG